MPPAARITDMHTCPMVTPPGIPHVGGPIMPPCSPTVLIGFLPAARLTDPCLCVGPPDMIIKGSPTVLINNLLAARIGDSTVHGGVIVAGCPTVMIGEQGAGSPVNASPIAGAVGSGSDGDVAAADNAGQPGGGGGGGGGSTEPPADVGPIAEAFKNAAEGGTALVCKGPCEACGQA